MEIVKQKCLRDAARQKKERDAHLRHFLFVLYIYIFKKKQKVINIYIYMKMCNKREEKEKQTILCHYDPIQKENKKK